MDAVGPALRVCFGLVIAVFMLINWGVCRTLLLCQFLPDRIRCGAALMATKLVRTGGPNPEYPEPAQLGSLNSCSWPPCRLYRA